MNILREGRRSGRARVRCWANSYDAIRGQKKKKKAVGKNDGKDVNIYASCKAVIAKEQPNHMLFKKPLSHTC